MEEARSDSLLADYVFGFFTELYLTIYGGSPYIFTNASGDIRSKSAVLFFAEPVSIGVNYFLVFVKFLDGEDWKNYKFGVNGGDPSASPLVSGPLTKTFLRAAAASSAVPCVRLIYY